MKKTKIVSEYKFTGFGFDVILHNVEMKLTSSGHSYPIINMNKVKADTVNALIGSKKRFNGKHIKFLRTYFDLSYRKCASILEVNHSTVKNWEEQGREFSGLSEKIETKFRCFLINELTSRLIQNIQIVQEETIDRIDLDEYKLA